MIDYSKDEKHIDTDGMAYQLMQFGKKKIIGHYLFLLKDWYRLKIKSGEDFNKNDKDVGNVS